MAVRKLIESDLSGASNASTTVFGLDDSLYEVDLTDAEREDLEKALAPYLDVARPAADRVLEKRREVPDMTPAERERIRDWAVAHDYEVSKWGRITKRVLKAYQEAHPEYTIRWI